MLGRLEIADRLQHPGQSRVAIGLDLGLPVHNSARIFFGNNIDLLPHYLIRLLLGRFRFGPRLVLNVVVVMVLSRDVPGDLHFFARMVSGFLLIVC